MTFPGEWTRLSWPGSAPSGSASLPVSLPSGCGEMLVEPRPKAPMFAMSTPSASSSRLSSVEESLPPKIDDSWESTSLSFGGSNAVPPRETDWVEVYNEAFVPAVPRLLKDCSSLKLSASGCEGSRSCIRPRSSCSCSNFSDSSIPWVISTQGALRFASSSSSCISA